MKSAPQIVFSGMYNEQLSPSEEGKCRLCGGPLLGKIQHCMDFYSGSGSWVDECYLVAPESSEICEPCRVLRKEYNKGLKHGVIATEKAFKRFETGEDVLVTLNNLPQEPFVLILKTWKAGTYRRHLYYTAPVNYNNEEISAMLVFHPWQTSKNDNSLAVCTIRLNVPKTLELVDQYLKEGIKQQVNPLSIEMSPEKHVASFIAADINKKSKK